MRLLTILFLLVGTSSCMADRITGYVGKVTLTRSGAFGSTSGGEFTLSGSIWDSSGREVSGLGFDDVRSFCVEYNEHLSLGTEYRFAITDYAVKGGVGGQDGALWPRDPLGVESKIIFSDWLDRRDDYASETNAARDDANYVQKAIWMNEEERTYTSTNVTDLIDDAVVRAGEGETPEGIRVLNLFTKAAEFGDLHRFAAKNDGKLIGSLARTDVKILKQDQIVALSSDADPPIVPEPASAMLFGIGVLAFGVVRRRRC